MPKISPFGKGGLRGDFVGIETAVTGKSPLALPSTALRACFSKEGKS